MKKKFILLMMMCLTLLGGVNLNVLNAQDQVTIGGDATSYNVYYPIAFGANYQLSQHVYTADEIGHAAGTIEKIAFKVNVTQTRNLTFYLKNTSIDALSGWQSYTDADMVFHSDAISTAPTDGWITFELDTPFEYTGGNILLTAADNTGSYTYVWSAGNAYKTLSRNATFYVNGSNPVSASSGYSSTRQPSIRFTFGEAQDDLEPAVPANLTATAINHASIELTWDAAENAISYNIYKNGTLVGPASTTSYLVEGLDANTGYCFTVTGVRGAKESAASEQVCTTTAKAPLVREVSVGAGDATNFYIPTYTNYNYTTTQQIYTAEELGFGAGNVLKIAFNNTTNAQYTRNIDVYIANTTKSYFSSSDMINMTSEDKVYSGSYTFKYGWNEIELSKNFEYSGNNILICVDDNTGSYPGTLYFTVNTTSEARAIYYCSDYTSGNYDPLAVAGKYSTALSQNNQIKFFVEAEPGVKANVEAIEFAEVKLGNYWSEKYNAPSAEVKVENIGAEITSIESSNDFFVLSENIDLAASNIVFNVTCKTETSYAGTQNGNIVISYEIEGEASTIEIPVTATAYAPERPDVIELAQGVRFSQDGSFSNTPIFANLHDDYILPNEVNEGETPDAVYHFTLNNPTVLTATVTGTNAIAAIYKAEDIDLENNVGPSSNNNYNGEVLEIAPTTPTSFFYDFEDGSLEDFNFVEYDGNNNHWQITDEYGVDNKLLISYSYTTGINKADNYIITKSLYGINANSKLSFDAKCGGNYNGWDYVMIKVSTDGEVFTLIETVEPNSQSWIYGNTVDLGAKLAEKGLAYGDYYIALHHKRDDIYSIQIDNLRLSDGSETRGLAKVQNVEPQINAVKYPAGEYYLVAAAEDEFSVTLKAESVPAPEALTEMAPANGAMEQSNPKLSWTFGRYTEEYQVLLGTTNPPTEVVVDWSSELTTSFQTEGLANQTTYYWQVNTRNITGTTTGEVYSFNTPLNQATELAVTDAELYPGETTKLTWTAAESAISYNVYVNEVLFAEAIEETSFELTNLPYNVNPGNAITVTAVHTLGESAHSEAVNVKMAGTFNLVVNVKDAEGNAMENAAVAFNTTYYYDEYYQLVPAIDTLYTDADGKATQTLALPCEYGAPNWTYSSLDVTISKKYAVNKYIYINSNSGIYNGEDYVQNITLEYKAPENVQTDKNLYVAGEDMMVLTWNKVEGAIAYNIYRRGEYNYETSDYEYTLLNTEAITDTTFSIESLEYDPSYPSVAYAVSAVYSFGESAKTFAYAEVTAKGTISGKVTDGTNPIEGAVVTIRVWYDESTSYATTTDVDGKFSINAIVGYYNLTVTRYDYKDYSDDSRIEVIYGTPNELDDIVLEQNAVVEFDVTAVESGEYVNVSWTAPENATSYNIYRRDSEGNVQRVYSDVTSLTATDYYWSTLENGTYEYGVSAVVEVNRSYTEGFENGGNLPEGWTTYHTKTTSTYDWTPTTYAYNKYPIEGSYAVYSNTNGSGSATYGDFYLVAPLYDLTGIENPVLTFYRHSPDYYASNYSTTSYTNTLKVFVSTESATGPWTEVYSNGYNTMAWTQETVSLAGYEDQQIYVAFSTNVNYGRCTAIDNVVFPSISISSESAINWSAPIEKLIVEFTGAEGNNWDNAANWNTNEVPTGKNVNVKADAVISSAANVKNLNIASGKLLTIDNGGALTVTGTITNNGSLVLNDGAQLFQSNESVYATFDMDIINPTSWENSNKDGWQFIASPFNAASVMSFTGLSWAPKSYDLYKYDGTAEGAEWNNHKDGNFEDAFVNGRGYLASYETLDSVALSGYLYNKDYFDFTEVTYTEGKDFANFHLLGNPFPFNMDMSRATAEGMATGYAVVNAEGNYEYLTSGTVAMGDGFFVQAIAEEAAFSYDHKNVPTRSSRQASSINVIASGKAGKDNVIINFAGQSEGFNKLQNFNDEIATVFVANNGKRYGIANVDENVSEVELSFVASQMGNYSISLDINGEFEEVTLVDRFAGIETNMLLENEYNFTATSRDNANRFVVKLDNRQQTTDNSQFVYQSGEELILSIEGSVQIIDMLGRVVYSNEHSNGDNRINVSEFNNAAYVVRVVNAEGVKSQKVVIY